MSRFQPPAASVGTGAHSLLHPHVCWCPPARLEHDDLTNCVTNISTMDSSKDPSLLVKCVYHGSVVYTANSRVSSKDLTLWDLELVTIVANYGAGFVSD